MGNFFCDILMCAVHANCALLNGGAFRSDKIHPIGSFKVKDLESILSFNSELVVVTVTGKYIN